MGEISQWKCDAPGCEAVRKPENHWWVIKFEAGMLALRPMGDDPVDPQELTLCGEKCVVNRISTFMSSQKPPDR